ncbi:hypothetical protein A4R29_15265 [Mesorhizobium ciceri biovar biserrulae]|nr:hypothetical protein A4R29_15265 [Mesorhizobium ciceri biovar biserrulae]
MSLPPLASSFLVFLLCYGMLTRRGMGGNDLLEDGEMSRNGDRTCTFWIVVTLMAIAFATWWTV